MRFEEALASVPAVLPGEFEQFARHLRPEWIEDALCLTGTASVRRRRLPAEQVLWLCVAALLHLALSSTRGPLVAKSARVQARKRLGPESRQFDFWVEEWTVSVAGAHVGDSKVERIANDCVLLENWTAVGGGNGKRFNLYDRTQKRWRQTWVDSSGNITDYVGSFVGGSMRYEARVVRPDGRRVRRRMTFSQSAPGQVRQLIEDSTDGGKTWSVGFDGPYARKAGS